ncbi:formylglycine-generating enzyme family protein [Deefgea tanakiae]|uniref:Formylglycine-generating enzyme family protein n=1 Tax=Deefgea tanakiae TaxID=2865840 RepID=A0ABX8ZBH2_9NEIS|nr:formylglycine-generating enzyme family protein [Deefgea tanakiae]QZA78674.1 formylglycine-generating enzyme family protein [Deefgea tanakiae]
MKALAASLLVVSVISMTSHAAEYRPITGGTLRTALPLDGDTVEVAAYQLRALPVSQQEFKRFVLAHPQWRRDHVTPLFAGQGYLSSWKTPQDFAPNLAAAPVTQVSWYAAAAFCESEGAALPTWVQWEFAAAADETRQDARKDPLWRAKILGWYETLSLDVLPAMALHPANVFGVYDLHQSIWEWVDDFNGLFVNVDSRAQGEQKVLETCGAAALSLGDKENYAVLMRIALLTALKGQDTVNTLGFRCAKPASKK